MQQLLTHFFASAQNISIVSQGLPIALSVWKKHPEAVTVLFYPGTMASPKMYVLFLHALFSMGCNVVGIHPLSHGLSQNIKKDFIFDDILANGLDAQRWVQSHFDGPVVVCGHSQGGILALAHALDNREIAASFPIGTLLPHEADAGSVTRFAPFLRYKDRMLCAMGRAAAFMPRFPLHFLMYLQLHRIVSASRKVYAPRTQSRQTYPLSFVHSLFTKDLSAVQRPGHIHCPVCVISAKDDALFSFSMMQDIVRSIKAPQKSCICIEGGGHLAPLSMVYGRTIAAHISGQCAGLGLPLYICE